MTFRIAALALTLALLAPSAALAQQDPFGPLPQPQQTPAPPPEEPADPFGGDDVGRDTLYIIAGCLLIAFVAVGVYISRDARRALPKHRRRDPDRLREQGPHKHERRAKAKARAKGRQARAARKVTKRKR